MNNVEIDGFKIGSGKVFVVAELGSSHCQDFDKAKELIRLAKESGANAVKIQTYTPDSMTLDVNTELFTLRNCPWAGQTLYELYKQTYLPMEWQPQLKHYADEIGITFFSTPFSIDAVDFLETLDVPCYKIASFEICDIPLIERIAQTGKPVFFSIGASKDYPEICRVGNIIGRKKTVPLHCVSSYPARPEDSCLMTIPALSQTWGGYAGLSDHSSGIAIAIAAVALGAKVIEKHIKLPDSKGADSSFSITPDQFKMMVEGIREVENAVTGVKFNHENKLRRSLWVAANMRKGDIFTTQNVRCVRPDGGLHPSHLKTVLGSCANKDIIYGTPMSFDLVM